MYTVPVDEAYFEWLYSHVGTVRSRSSSLTHWRILRQLYTKEFSWFIHNDDNRVEDGRCLRREFVNELQIDVDPEWMSLGCSFLEMLMGLARRASFLDGETPREWFWHFMQVMHIDVYNDAMEIPEQEIDELLDRIIWRQYEPNGDGGLFPLKHPDQDQRKVEIWYQLNAYLLENDDN